MYKVTIIILLTIISIGSYASKSATEIQISANQLGFTSSAPKVVIIETDKSLPFSLINLENNRSVLSGALSQPASWALADDKKVAIADFSDVIAEG